MRQPVILNLGNKGVVSDPTTRLELAFAHMFEANHSQAPIHDGQVMSIQYVASLYGNDPDEFALQLRSALKAYFGRLFPDGNAEAEVSIKDKEEARYVVRIAVRVSEAGQTFQLNEAVFYDNTETTDRLLKAMK